MRIGLISDTHGLWRPQAGQFLQHCDHIVHAGDIGRAEILDRLRALAPLTVVRGNNDTADWAASLPHAQALALGDVSLFVLHDLKELSLHPAPAGTQVIVCGHSHRPAVLRRPDGVLVVNPGSAGPRRFSLPVSAAELLVASDGTFDARVVPLLG
jgi:putative phosphoesterase